MRRGARTLTRALGLCAALLPGTAPPAQAQSHLCDAAAVVAARETGVPLAVLLSLTRVETGRSREGGIEPWPWTLNIGGAGSWHDSAAAALAAAEAAIVAGRRNVDLGCFQINYHWHGAAFADLAGMLDPIANARHAAGFLTDLQGELGDWTLAAGAFHSRNPDHAARYLDRYREISAALSDPAVAPAPVVSRMAAIGPSPLPMRARPPLYAASASGLLRPARPVHAAPALPLWEP